jgi:23S rRNA (cytosine1962-C5)-methyltransferase
VRHADEVEQLLGDHRTAFVVVTTLEAAPTHEAMYLARELDRRDFHLGAIVANRVLPSSSPGSAAANSARKLEKAASGELVGAVGRALDADDGWSQACSRDRHPLPRRGRRGHPRGRAPRRAGRVLARGAHRAGARPRHQRHLRPARAGGTPSSRATRDTDRDTALIDDRERSTPDWRPSDRPDRRAGHPDALRQLRGGSPWLFDGSITSATDDGASPGDLAVVFDDRPRFAAIGLWDPDSPIRVKVLHVGDPATIDADVVVAPRPRRSTAGRDARGRPRHHRVPLVHGENDGLGGWWSTGTPARWWSSCTRRLVSPPRAVLDALIDQLAPRASRAAPGRAHRARTPRRSVDGDTLFGPEPDAPVRFRSAGCLIEADVVRGHKTGHFLDQRDNRGLVRGMAAGREGARRVREHRRVLGVGRRRWGQVGAPRRRERARARDRRRNLAHNRHIALGARVPGAHHGGRRVRRDARPRRPGERYDLVVLDPPSFAHDAAGVPAARARTVRLTRPRSSCVRRGGSLVQASCSSRVDDEEFFQIVARGGVARRCQAARDPSHRPPASTTRSVSSRAPTLKACSPRSADGVCGVAARSAQPKVARMSGSKCSSGSLR